MHSRRTEKTDLQLLQSPLIMASTIPYSGDYKGSYFQAAKDMRRHDLNITELCAIKWVLHFKQSVDGMSPFEAKFNEDFSLMTPMHGRMDWQVNYHIELLTLLYNSPTGSY